MYVSGTWATERYFFTKRYGNMLQKDIYFSHKVQMVQAKMNSYLKIPSPRAGT